MTVEQALKILLDNVDYTLGNCGITDMVGAVFDVRVITMARKALRESCNGPKD